MSEFIPHGGEHARSRAPDANAERRPGVPLRPPRTSTAPGAHVPVRHQPTSVNVTMRAGLHEPTPVFGTAQPPRGISGKIRRFAYTRPDHRPSHWLLLLAADRVDVVESAVRRRWPLVAGLLAIAAIRKVALGGTR